MNLRALVQPLEATWEFSNGHAKTGALGIKTLALAQPIGDTWTFSIGLAKTAVQKNDTGSRKATGRSLEISRQKTKIAFPWSFGRTCHVLKLGICMRFCSMST